MVKKAIAEEYKVPIKNIVFDIGNVLIKYNPLEFMRERHYEEGLIEKLDKLIFSGTHWPELDRGIINNTEATELFCREALELKEEIIKLMGSWFEMLTPVEKTPEIMERLREKGYKIYLLSNYHRDAFKYIENKYPFLKQVHGRVVSYELNILKPEEKIYSTLIEKYRLNPCETLFIDDTLSNVQGAEALGMIGIPFINADMLLSQLNELGIRL